MQHILHWLSKELLPEKPDPRVVHLPLMQSFAPSAIISLLYVILVWVWRKTAFQKQKLKTKTLPSSNGVQKSSQPIGFDSVKQVMIVYNLSMVIYSSYIVIETLIVVAKSEYGLGCKPLDYGTGPLQIRLINVGYLFYFSKFVEMLDTVFFLWRGKLDQVTFLHVFHHASMPPSIWWGMKYAPGGFVFMFPLLNSFVHVVMYSYYGLSAAGLHKYLWWKKYLTVMQMIQFVLLILHQGQVFFNQRDCTYPKVFPGAICMYAAIFLVLFGNFYIKSYWQRKRLHKSSKSSHSEKVNTVSNGTSNGVSERDHYLPNGTTHKRFPHSSDK